MLELACVRCLRCAAGYGVMTVTGNGVMWNKRVTSPFKLSHKSRGAAEETLIKPPLISLSVGRDSKPFNKKQKPEPLNSDYWSRMLSCIKRVC